MRHFFAKTLFVLLCCLGPTFLFAQLQDSILFYNLQQAQTAAPNGVGYDSGGPNGFYQSGEQSTLLIDPGCADKITITVSFYQVETCCDALVLFDGTSDNAPVLANISGTGAPVTLQANSGKVFLRWISDGSVEGAGFRFTWTSSLIPPVVPVVTFQVSDSNPALAEAVFFTAEATNYPTAWAWDFGDGNGSTQQNPSHRYNQSGEKTVQLITTNCHGLKDTAVTQIVVQEPPVLTPLSGSLTSTVGCGDTAQYSISFSNTGAGELFFSTELRLSGKPRVLIASDYANSTSLLGLSNLLGFYSNQYDVVVASLSNYTNALALLEETDILIFPTLDIGDPWPLMNYSAAIDSFISVGGSIIVCGQPYYHSPGSAFGLFPGSDYYTQEISGQTIQLTTTHPITNGLPATLTAPIVSNSLGINTANYVSLSTKNGKSIIGYRVLPKGNIVHLGFGFQTFNFNLAQLLTQALNWCGQKIDYSIVPAGGVLQPNDTLVIQVNLPTTGFFPGNYDGSLLLVSNDPAFSPNLQIPFSLTVTGQPVPVFAPSILQFDSIQQGTSQQKSVLIQNTGCSPLVITAIDSVPNGFLVDNILSTLAPYTDSILTITFNPIDTGTYSGNVVLSTNVGPLELPLYGYAEGAPNLQWDSDTLEVTLSCGDSLLLSIPVSNTGIGNLDLIADGGSQNGGSTLRALILDAVSYNSGIGSNMQNWLENRYEGTKYQVTRYHSNLLPSDLAATLQNMDLVVIPNYYNIWWMPPSELGAVLRNYLELGGTVVFTGSSFPYEFTQLGLSTVQNYLVTFSEPLGYTAPSDPLVENVSNTVAGPDPIFGWKFTDSEWQKIVYQANYTDYTVAGYKKMALGQLIYLGFEYYYDSEPGNTILKNAAEWAANGNFISFSEVEQSISSGTVDTLEVLVKAEDLLAGNYQVTANWLTNDPSVPILSIPISVIVTGIPQLATPQTQYNFGLTQQFTTKTVELEINNEGCDTLFILNASVDGADFMISQTPSYVKPYGTSKMAVDFKPSTPGTKTGTVLVETNGGVAQFNLTGIAIGAPFATFGPAELGVTLECEEAFSDTIDLINEGLSGLTYQFSQTNLPKKIGILFYGANYSRAINLQNFLINVDASAKITRIESESISQFADSLKHLDMLLIPSLESLYSNQVQVYNGFAPHLQAFLESGKNIAIMGVYNAPILQELGFFSGSSYQLTGFGTFQSPIKNHPLVADMDPAFLMDDNLVKPTFAASENMTKIWSFTDGSLALGYKRVGNGIVLFSANGYDYYSNRVLKMVSNITTWLQNPYPPGSQPVTKTGALSVGQTQALELNFDGLNVPAGTYPGFVRFTSNAPLQSKVQIPVQVQIANTPCAGFSVQYTNCSNVVQFQDASLNNIFTWYWQFGDGFDSFAQNPSHEYTQPGTYTASLVACSTLGCDTFTQQVVISTNVGPIPAVCTPSQSTALCCATGIYSVQVGSFLHSSPGSEEGYQDRSCALGVEIIRQVPYEVRVSTGNQQFEFVSVWIDYNNNGQFEQVELILNDNNLVLHSALFSAPAWAIKNIPLRMRVLSESSSYSWPGACGTPNNGQMEDYYVIVRDPSNTLSPTLLSDAVEVYPNPSSNACWLSFTTSFKGDYEITVTDELGKMIQTLSLFNDGQPVQLPIPASLAAGTYFIHIQTSNGVIVKKWQKI